MMPEEKFRRSPEVELYMVGDIPEEDINGLEDFLGDYRLIRDSVLLATNDRDHSLFIVPGDVLVRVVGERIFRHSRDEFESVLVDISPIYGGIWRALVKAIDKKNAPSAFDLHGDQ